MTEQIKCDNCGRTSEEPHMAGWRRVEFVADIVTMGSDIKDRHFCSVNCIHLFFAQEVMAGR